jgi:hypothetical protein
MAFWLRPVSGDTLTGLDFGLLISGSGLWRLVPRANGSRRLYLVGSHTCQSPKAATRNFFKELPRYYRNKSAMQEKRIQNRTNGFRLG